MPNELPPAACSLLACCAILRCFDHDILVALGQSDEDALATLLTSDQVEPLSDSCSSFQLRDQVRVTVLAQLRAEHPGAELVLHERAFTYFVNQIVLAATPEQRLLLEDCCFYHLDAMRLPLTERREWKRLQQHVNAARVTAPQRGRHLQRLELYDGLIAIQTQNYESGEAILNRLLNRDEVEEEVRMRALIVLAHASWFQTNYDRARTLYQQVYALACNLQHRPFQGFALINRSMIEHELGYYERALQLSRDSLHVFRELDDPYHEAHALYEVGKNNMHLSHWRAAQYYFREGAQIYERLNAQAQLANLYCLQATLYHALGDDAESEAHYLRSLEIGQSPEHGDVSVTMDAQLLLGLLYQTQQHWRQALQCYRVAIALARQLHNQHSLALALYRRGDVLKAIGKPRAAIASYNQALTRLERLRGSAKSEDVKLGLLGVTQQIYEAMVLLLLDQHQYVEAYHFVERARSRAFLDMLADRSPDLYTSFDQPVATLAEVQAQLPENAGLIEFYTTGVLPPGEHLINRIQATNARLFEHMVLPPRIFVFALTRTCFEVHELQIDPNRLRPVMNTLQPGRRWLQDRKLHALYDHLIGPVQSLLAGLQQIFLVPHGPLHHVPFMALRAPDGRTLLDHDGPAISLVPSATVLVRNCLSRPRLREGKFLALGYNNPSVDLRHAESEARTVARVMHGEAWTGPEPKSGRLTDAVTELRGLHIAGHAVYRPLDPLGSHLSLGIDDELTARTVIRSLNLRADLVTLSACTSGLTEIAAGDEMLGLLRAWLYAGATTIVCALWDVADIVTRLMMERFYEALSQDVSPGIAFRDALLAIRQITGRELAAIFTRWQAEDVAFGASLPEVPPEAYDTYPYAHAQVWAPFMLIGRP